MASSFMVARTSLSAAEAQALEQSMKTGGVMEGYVRRKPHNPHKVKGVCAHFVACLSVVSIFTAVRILHLPPYLLSPSNYDCVAFVIIRVDPATLFLFDAVVVHAMPGVDVPVTRREITCDCVG